MSSKDSYWFRHDSTAGRAIKMRKMAHIYNHWGKGVYWDVIEILRDQSKYSFECDEFGLEMLCDLIGCKDFIKFENWFKDCVKFNLFKIDSKKSTFICPALSKNMEKWESSKANGSLGGRPKSKPKLNPKETQNKPNTEPKENHNSTVQYSTVDNSTEDNRTEEKKEISFFNLPSTFIKNDEVYFRNLQSELIGKFPHIPPGDVFDKYVFKWNSFLMYCRYLKLKFENEKHIRNSFKLFALKYWFKTHTQMEHILKSKSY